MTTPRRAALLTTAVVIVAAAAWGYSTLNGASTGIDPSRMATVERGTMVRSVVATGKIEPITKVEIKSKANGIIERLLADVDQVVAAGQVLGELDKENLTARVREARANLQAAEAAREGVIAQLKKNEIEAEAPDVAFGRRNRDRAMQLFEQRLISQSGLDEASNALEQAENRQRAAGGQLVVAQARVVEATANVAQARAAVERAEEELTNATIRAPIRATVLTRDVEVGSPVSSILNLGANATLVMTLGDIERVFVRGKVDEADIGRVRLDQAARITTEMFRDRAFEGRVTQISPIGVERDVVVLLAYGEGFNQAILRGFQGAFGDGVSILFGGQTSMQAGGERAGRPVRLRLADGEAVSELPLVKAWSPEFMQGVTVVWGTTQGGFRARAVAPAYGVMRPQPIAAGRFVDAEDVRL